MHKWNSCHSYSLFILSIDSHLLSLWKQQIEYLHIILFQQLQGIYQKIEQTKTTSVWEFGCCFRLWLVTHQNSTRYESNTNFGVDTSHSTAAKENAFGRGRCGVYATSRRVGNLFASGQPPTRPTANGTRLT